MRVEVRRFAYRNVLDFGRKNCAIDLRMTKPLLMSVMNAKIQRVRNVSEVDARLVKLSDGWGWLC